MEPCGRCIWQTAAHVSDGDCRPLRLIPQPESRESADPAFQKLTHRTMTCGPRGVQQKNRGVGINYKISGKTISTPKPRCIGIQLSLFPAIGHRKPYLTIARQEIREG